MSVLIRGMEMPKSCHACCFFGQADIWESDFDGYTKSFCKRTGSQTYDYVDKFLPNCPLVPVPPHGRLIDADALCETLRKLVDNEYTPAVFANWIEHHIDSITPGEYMPTNIQESEEGG